MRSVTYSMSVSLDGYIVGPDGDFDWTVPDEEVFRFWIDEIREVGVHLLGRRLYETMLYWESADQDPSLDDSELEWAAIWKPLLKVVFSTTLSAVQGNARLASGGLAEEIERLRAERGEGDIAIGGATLAAEAAALGLIDEYRAMVYPVLVGGGIPFFPQRERRVDLELVETPPSARESSTSATAWRASRLPVRYRGGGVGWLGCTGRVSGLLGACPRGNEGDGDIRPKNPTNLDPNVRVGSEQVAYEGAQGALEAGID
jgi:dihydrofolate reductase